MHLPPSTARTNRGINLLGKSAAQEAALNRLEEKIDKMKMKAKELRVSVRER